MSTGELSRETLPPSETSTHRPGGDSSPSVSEETEEARLPTSMFDRSGPRLKARPKRPNN